MNVEPKERVWNRACLLDGGTNPGVGDRALADALKIHGLVMNGGVHHAVETAAAAEVKAAMTGFEYFGLLTIAELLREVLSDSRLREWNEDTEAQANRRYWELLPNDDELVARFELLFHSRPEDFAGLDSRPGSKDQTLDE
jgi:hypothetical protein